MKLLFTESTETNIISIEEIVTSVIEWLSTSGIKLLIGVIALFIVFAIINGITKRIRSRMIKKQRDATIVNVVFKISRLVLKAAAFFMFLSFVGIDTAGIGSIIASCAVAIGLALQGSLSNLAGGLVILIMRPFKIGDYIAAQGESGTVEEISIFYTYMITPDNKVVMIPNGTLANGSIVNYSTKDLRRVDFEFSISYDEDFEKAKKVIYEVIENTNGVLFDPQPLVRVISHGESTINIVTRVWTENANYWNVYFDMMESIKKSFDNSNIEIPYNQLDVHIKNK